MTSQLSSLFILSFIFTVLRMFQYSLVSVKLSGLMLGLGIYIIVFIVVYHVDLNVSRVYIYRFICLLVV